MFQKNGNVLRDRAYAKNPNLNGMSVFGNIYQRK